VVFGSHGLADPQNGMLSCPVLATPRPQSEEDGYLQAQEVLDLELDADLVILSACETGLGRWRSGEGLVGLSAAFFIAGAESVCASLWQVPQLLVAPQSPCPQKPKPALKSAIALAFEFQRLLDDSVANNRAKLADRYGISRARVTQVLNILRLPPKVLSLLADSGDAMWSERQLRRILVLPSPEAQIAAFERLSERGASAETHALSRNSLPCTTTTNEEWPENRYNPCHLQA
jgi:hypothetical protein